MKKSYSFKYLKIYFWQILSILLNLLSLFIVVPQLTVKPEVYGIYSICVSLLIFLSYADLGFLNATFKFASEYYASGKKEEEIKVIGFGSCILLCVIILFSVMLTVLSFHPEWLIKNIAREGDILVARKLLIILAVFSPAVVLQRALQIVFGVRLEDYIFQKILVASNIIRIASVFYFFRSGHYDIVNYFLFIQVVSLIGLLIAFRISKNLHSIGIVDFLKALRVSKSIYQKVKSLAFSSLFVTISWILYYELDVYAIAKLSGVKAVAYYSVGLTCLTFFRAIFGALFNPFTARFNYFIASDDDSGLKSLYKMVICIMLPIVVFPVLSLFFLSKQFISTWVGTEFKDSINVTRFLVLSNILGFISYPGSILLVAKQKIKMIYSIAAILPIIFWAGIVLTYSYFDYAAFSYFKLLAFLINGSMYIYFSIKYLDFNIIKFYKEIIKPAILPVISLITVLVLVRQYLPLEKNKTDLLMVIGTGTAATTLSFFIYFFSSKLFRAFAGNLLVRIYNQIGFRNPKFL